MQRNNWSRVILLSCFVRIRAIAGVLALSIFPGAEAQLFPPEIGLITLNGQNGFRLDGVAEDDRTGYSVSAAGDVNGDGFDDLIVGAPMAHVEAGSVYVVFGRSASSSFPVAIDLGSLDGVTGFEVYGSRGHHCGWAVSAAGDVNGDGIGDFMIGCPHADFTGEEAGSTFVVFGRESAFPAAIHAGSAISQGAGFRLDGPSPGEQSGRGLGSSGDINDDGIDDLIIGAPRADPNGIDSGRSYVVFGRNTAVNPFDQRINLGSLNGHSGFALHGESDDDFSGWSVRSTGDINSDGIDDLVIGAWRAYANGSASGRSYVVFGSKNGFSHPFELSSLDGSNGLSLNGERENDFSGMSVSSAGDVNGDGIDDLMIGADSAEPNGSNSGRSYVVFGSQNGFAHPFELSSLNGANGFAINGEAMGDASGWSVSSAGDINDDGIDDLIIGAYLADPNGSASGRSYVVFGSQNGFSHPFELSSLNGANGFVLNGEAEGNGSGWSVSSAGDINGDGIDDLVIGAPSSNVLSGTFARTYVVFGRSEQLFNDRFEPM